MLRTLCPGCSSGSNPCGGARSRAPVHRVGAAPLVLLYSSQGQEHQDQQAGTGQSQHGQWSVPRCLADLLLSQDHEWFILLLLLLHQYFSFLVPEPVLLPGNLCLYQERQWDILLLLDSCSLGSPSLREPSMGHYQGWQHTQPSPSTTALGAPATPMGQSHNSLPSGKLKSHPAHQNYLMQ